MLQSVLLCSLTGSLPPPYRPWAAPKSVIRPREVGSLGRKDQRTGASSPDTPAPPIPDARPSDCQSGIEDQRVLPPILQIRKPAQTGKRASNAEWGPSF